MTKKTDSSPDLSSAAPQRHNAQLDLCINIKQKSDALLCIYAVDNNRKPSSVFTSTCVFYCQQTL